MKKLVLAVLMGGVFLNQAACAGFFEPTTDKEIYDKVTYKIDNYTKTRKYSSPIIFIKKYKYLDPTTIEGYIGLIKDSQSDDYFLSLRYEADNWAFLSEAYDSDGNKLPVAKIDQKVGTFVSKTNVVENISIDLPKSYLLDHVDKGLDIKLLGKRNEAVIKIPAFYIKGFLDAVEFSEKTKFASE